MKILILLLFIAFVSSNVIPKKLIKRNIYLCGKIENGSWIFPNKTALIRNESKACPPGTFSDGNKCIEINIFRYTKHVLLPHKKPVIYLYPKETMDISVNLNMKYINFDHNLS